MVDAIASRRRAIAGDRFFPAQKNQIRILHLRTRPQLHRLVPVYISVPRKVSSIGETGSRDNGRLMRRGECCLACSW